MGLFQVVMKMVFYAVSGVECYFDKREFQKSYSIYLPPFLLIISVMNPS
jgi:hypothetical protein